MTLDQLKTNMVSTGNVAEAQAAALAAQYGPTVVQMATTDLQAWLNYVFVGQYSKAYGLYLKTLNPTGILAEWDKEHAAWAADNRANADKIALANRIGQAFCAAMLPVVLAAVGL
jgi:sugar phosphate isomerase/epimerase